MSGVVWLWSIEHQSYWLLGRLHQSTGLYYNILRVEWRPTGAPGICLARWSQCVPQCASVCLCRVEFPHISQFLLMLALRVRLAALELTSLVTHGIILPSHLTITHHRTPRSSWSIFRRETGVRCDSHQFWWQVSLAGFVLSAPGSLINLSRVVTRCAPAQLQPPGRSTAK